jgi:hypothetical protein
MASELSVTFWYFTMFHNCLLLEACTGPGQVKVKLSRYTPWWRLGGSGGVAPTHSEPRHQMGVSGQHDAPAALFPRGKVPPVPTGQEARWAPEPVWAQGLETNSSASVGDRTPIVQSVVRHYTDWATRPGQVAQIIFGFGPGSNDSNQTLYRTFRAFSGHSFFARKELFVVAFILYSWHSHKIKI